MSQTTTTFVRRIGATTTTTKPVTTTTKPVTTTTKPVTTTTKPVTTTTVPVIADPLNATFVGLSSTPASMQTAMTTALQRWTRALPVGLPDIDYAIPADACGNTHTYPSRIDDFIVVAETQAIDGPGGQLAVGGLCLYRKPSGLPFVGLVRVDRDDLAGLVSSGQLVDVLTHELGHVLGIGGAWNIRPELIDSRDPAHRNYVGPAAVAAWKAAGGSGPVPIEDAGGASSAGIHWRESVLTNELMTGVRSPTNPLSTVSLGALADLGFTVDYSKAEPWSSTVKAAPRSGSGAALDIADHEFVISPVGGVPAR